MPPEYSHYSDDAQLEHALNEAEKMLVALKERFTQVKEAKRCREELLQQQNILKQKQRSRGSRNNRQQIKSQLQQINQELEAIEVSLESSLFSWSSLQEPFWLAVRFGGLGVVLGWFLKHLAG